jgi:uncharacterized protein (DUF2062 family)
MFIASVAMLLRGRVMKVLIIAPLLGTFLACVISSWVEGAPTSLYFYVLVYWGVNLVARRRLPVRNVPAGSGGRFPVCDESRLGRTDGRQ